MTLISKEKTQERLRCFADRFKTQCVDGTTQYEQGFLEGIQYAIKSLDFSEEEKIGQMMIEWSEVEE